MLSNTIVITFSGTDTHKELQEEFDSLYKDYFYKHLAYTGNWLKQTDFYKENQKLFRYEKYFGYFLWKPFIISKTLEEYPEYNILYCDSNLRFSHIREFENVYDRYMETEGIFLIKHKPHINKDWTKRDVFVYLDMDNEKYWNAHQIWHIISGWTTRSKLFLDMYFRICKIPYIVNDEPSIAENLPGFREHRWEQSVLSLLAEKHNVNGPWDLDMFKYISKIYPDKLREFKKTQ